MPKKRNITDRLKILFSRKILVKRFGKDKMKVIDLSRSQSDDNLGMIDRYRRLHGRGGIIGSYNDEYAHANRNTLYSDYEIMDNDPIISSALDILADESTLKNPSGDILKIKTENDNVREVLHNLYYDIMNIEYNVWPLVRNLCKFGDFYWYLDLEPKMGIKNVIPISPHIIQRIEGYDSKNMNAYKFVIDDLGGNSYLNFSDSNQVIENYQIAHFRLLSDTAYLPYGKSFIENVRNIYKQLSLMEDAMLLVRIMRAPERRIFKIDIGNLPPEDVEAHIEEVKNQMQKTPYKDPVTQEYNLRYNLMNMLEDFFLPVRGSDSGTSIDTLQGLNTAGQIEDVEYLKAKLLSGLKVPPAFLGYSTDLGGRATLAALDIRFARTIERLQRVVISELKKIGIIHLYMQGFNVNDIVNFDLSLTSPSIVYERQKIEFMSEQMALVETMLSNNIFSYRYIYETVFGLTETEWKEIQEEMLTDAMYKFRSSGIESSGEDPFDKIETESGEESFGDSEFNDESGNEETSGGDTGSASKINAGYDEDGRQEMNRVTKPEPNPLGPDFYKKGVLSPESQNTDKPIIKEDKINFMDEKNLEQEEL